MFYSAETPEVAVGELGSPAAQCSVAEFEMRQPFRVVDFANLPDTPGIFSTAPRERILGLAFLHEFALMLSQPIARDERAHIEYTPTQVLTEFLRDFKFKSGSIEGVRYKSSVVKGGTNLVLFATQNDVIGGYVDPDSGPVTPPWIALVSAWQQRI
jgi:RES domain